MVSIIRTLRTAIILVGLMLASAVHSDAQDAETPSTPSKWEPQIQAFEAADKTNAPPKNAVLFVGSSSIRMWKTLADDFPDHKVINRGFGGSQMADSVAFAERIILPHQPKTVLVYAGDNDIKAGKSPEQVLADFMDLVAKIHKELPETRIGFIAIKPSIARWHLVEEVRKANEMVRDYAAKDKRLFYVDVFTPMLGEDGKPPADLFIKDNLHLSEKGYEIWAASVRPHLK